MQISSFYRKFLKITSWPGRLCSAHKGFSTINTFFCNVLTTEFKLKKKDTIRPQQNLLSTFQLDSSYGSWEKRTNVFKYQESFYKIIFKHFFGIWKENIHRFQKDSFFSVLRLLIPAATTINNDFFLTLDWILWHFSWIVFTTVSYLITTC